MVGGDYLSQPRPYMGCNDWEWVSECEVMWGVYVVELMMFSIVVESWPRCCWGSITLSAPCWVYTIFMLLDQLQIHFFPLCLIWKLLYCDVTPFSQVEMYQHFRGTLIFIKPVWIKSWSKSSRYFSMLVCLNLYQNKLSHCVLFKINLVWKSDLNM